MDIIGVVYLSGFGMTFVILSVVAIFTNCLEESGESDWEILPSCLLISGIWPLGVIGGIIFLLCWFPGYIKRNRSRLKTHLRLE